MWRRPDDPTTLRQLEHPLWGAKPRSGLAPRVNCGGNFSRGGRGVRGASAQHESHAEAAEDAEPWVRRHPGGGHKFVSGNRSSRFPHDTSRPDSQTGVLGHQCEVSVQGEQRHVQLYGLLRNHQVWNAHLVYARPQARHLKCANACPIGFQRLEPN